MGKPRTKEKPESALGQPASSRSGNTAQGTVAEGKISSQGGVVRGVKIDVGLVFRSVIFISIGIVTAMSTPLLDRLDEQQIQRIFSGFVVVLGLSGVLFGIGALFQMYLSGGFEGRIIDREDVVPAGSSASSPNAPDGGQKKPVVSSEVRDVGLSIDVEKIIDAAVETVSERLVHRALTGEDPGSSDPLMRHYSNLRSDVRFARERLQAEVRSIQRRGNSNLVLGGLTTMTAIVVLLWVSIRPVAGLVAAGSVDFWIDFVPIMLPKISLALFIEIFSFFFLRLYRSSVQEVKYFQNEITNLDAKAVAVEVALLSGDRDALKVLAGDLSRTERNFVLKKDETTVELEVAKAEIRGLREVMSAVKGLLRPDRSEKP